jgi:hypothetical protein
LNSTGSVIGRAARRRRLFGWGVESERAVEDDQPEVGFVELVLDAERVDPPELAGHAISRA